MHAYAHARYVVCIMLTRVRVLEYKSGATELNQSPYLTLILNDLRVQLSEFLIIHT